MTFLVLGGTAMARELAVRLQHAGMPVVCALLGAEGGGGPRPPVEVVAGGFGGVEGTRKFLLARQVRAVVDATHPFSGVTAGVLTAATTVGIPMVRLLAPSWAAQGGGPQWRWADDDAGAVRLATVLGAHRPFLNVGREPLRTYTVWADRYVLVRVPEVPAWPLPERWEVIRSLDGNAYASEFALLTSRRIGLMVTHDTGGSLAEPKLRVAADLGIFVVVVHRPAQPAGLRQFQTVPEAYGWVCRRWRPQDYC